MLKNDMVMDFSLNPESIKNIERIYNDVEYSVTNKNLKLDIYLPNDRTLEPFPVVVYFHGVAFMYGDKRDSALEPMLRGIEKGYAVVSVEYRLSPEALFPAMVYDAKCAIRFLKAKSSEYHLDKDKIALWGPSSGGWLVSMVALTPSNPAFTDLSMGYEEESESVNLVIDWCGPTSSFLKMDEEFIKSKLGRPDHSEESSPESKFLGIKITSCKELVKLASPITYVNKDMPPFLIIHGGADQVVPVEQSIDFYNRIKEVAGEDKAELFVAKNQLHHGAKWYHELWVSDICFEFIKRIFKK